MKALLAGAWLATVVSPAMADEPLLRPSRDVDVVYRAHGAGDPEQRVRWLAASQTMRIDPPGGGLYVIIDYVARRMSIVKQATRSVIDMAAPDSMADALNGKSTGGYVRRGQATVAGQACTEWQTLDREGRPALVCITADGVLLRVGAVSRERVAAIAVHYAPQDPALFRVPSDYAHHSPGAAR